MVFRFAAVNISLKHHTLIRVVLHRVKILSVGGLLTFYSFFLCARYKVEYIIPFYAWWDIEKDLLQPTRITTFYTETKHLLIFYSR